MRIRFDSRVSQLANPEPMCACILQENGVSVVLDAIRTHPTAVGTQLNACALIKELAEYQPCLQQLDEGGARSLLNTAIDVHQLNPDLTARAEEALNLLPTFAC